MSCTLDSFGAPCRPPDFGLCRSLHEMVNLFLRERGDLEALERAWWGATNIPFDRSTHRAMFTFGAEAKRDRHQRPFSSAILRDMGRRLASRESSFAGLPDFLTLYRTIESSLGLSSGQSPLLVYDIAHRLGYRLGIEPDEVYLHAGPKCGANALKAGLGDRRSRPLADFPTSIRTRLSAAQAEDFLCVAAKYLRADIWD